MEWVPISANEAFPKGAVNVGSTKTDGVVFVGRYPNDDATGAAGKINTQKGTADDPMCNFYSHGIAKQTKDVGVLVLKEGTSYDWVTIEQGSPIPAGAVVAGTTKTDGINYVGRGGEDAGEHKEEPGKINCAEGEDGNEAMHLFWGHGNNPGSLFSGGKGSTKAEILVLKGDAAPPKPPVSEPDAPVSGGDAATAGKTKIVQSPKFARISLRIEPKEEGGSNFTHALENGTKVEVLEVNDKWVKVKGDSLQGGPTEGWLDYRNLQEA